MPVVSLEGDSKHLEGTADVLQLEGCSAFCQTNLRGKCRGKLGPQKAAGHLDLTELPREV